MDNQFTPKWALDFITAHLASVQGGGWVEFWLWNVFRDSGRDVRWPFWLPYSDSLVTAFEVLFEAGTWFRWAPEGKAWVAVPLGEWHALHGAWQRQNRACA